MASRWYVPELHDLHPGMEGRLGAMLDALPQDARRAAALLVVPDWQGRHPLGRHGAFARRLARLPGEKVLHGLTHSLGPSLLNHLLYGHDDRSEFARLPRDEAGRRLSLGSAALETAFGAAPRWFCAPRWSQGAAATEAVRKAGFVGWMLHDHLVPSSGVPIPLPALCFDEGERRWRRALAAPLRAALIARLLAAGRPFRLTLHPTDPDDPAAWAQVTSLVDRLEREGWEPVTVDEALRRAGSGP